jgi:diadenosine tetraphosphate (Ap4A) HIT family hydrolase
VASIFDLGREEQIAIWDMVGKVRGHLIQTGAADAFNIGVNDGLAAGQTVAHAHVHVIPRRSGDVADPRGGIRWIIPEKANYWSA